MTGLWRTAGVRAALVLSSHDYETAHPGAIHAITEGLATTIERVGFVTLRPPQAFWRGMTGADPDQRDAEWTGSGRIRHRVARSSWPLREGRAARTPWLRTWPQALADAVGAADLIIAHSDLAAASVRWLRRHAAAARIAYLAIDRSDATVGSVRTLERQAEALDGVVTMASALLPRFAAFGARAYAVPCGIDRSWCDRPHPSPFGRDRAIVAIAAGPLDLSVIQIAAVSHPDMTIHLIGAPPSQRYPFNVREHGPMPLRDAVPFLQHAEIGLMALADTPGMSDLAETSPELTLFGHLGVPVVCPAQAAGAKPMRAGYEPGRSASVRDALLRAFRMARDAVRVPAPDWSEVAAAVVGTIGSPARSHHPHSREARHAG